MGTNQRHLVRMSDEEVDAYLSVPRAATMATLGPDGLIHQIAMYFVWFDGAVHVLSKAKAQKIVNLRRDPRCSFHVESGASYDELAGVNVAGRAELLEDEASLWEIGTRLAAQRGGADDEARRERVAHTVRNRVGVRVRAERIVSWDHSKLPAGSYPSG